MRSYIAMLHMMRLISDHNENAKANLPKTNPNQNLFRSGTIAPFTINVMVVFCRRHENFFATSLSGKTFLTIFVKWSPSINERLCSATISTKRVSATITRLVISWSLWLTKNDVNPVIRSFVCEARSRFTCCDVAAWRRAS